MFRRANEPGPRRFITPVWTTTFSQTYGRTHANKRANKLAGRMSAASHPSKPSPQFLSWKSSGICLLFSGRGVAANKRLLEVMHPSNCLPLHLSGPPPPSLYPDSVTSQLLLKLQRLQWKGPIPLSRASILQQRCSGTD